MKKSTNFKALFVLGISLLAAGTGTDIIAISIVGFVFLIISLVNRKEWVNKD